MAERTGFRRLALRRGVPIALGGIIVTTAGTGWALAGDSGPDYRTAIADVGSVAQLASYTGTVETLGRASAAFGVAGTVDEVAVAAGDRVEKGDVLATLDKDDLRAAVRAAQATLAEAQATLESDSESGSSSSGSLTSGSSGSGSSATSSGSSGTPSAGSNNGSSGSGGSGGPNGGSDAPSDNPSGSPSGGGSSFQVDLTQPIKAVNEARKEADLALTAADGAMAAQAAACVDVLSEESGDGDDEGPEVTPSPSPEPDEPAGEDEGAGDDGSGDSGSGDSGAGSASSDGVNRQSLLDCVDALKAVQAAQTKVAAAQAAVDSAGDAFTAAMNDAVSKLVADAAAAAEQAKKQAKEAAEQAIEQATAAAKAAAAKAAEQAAADQAAQQRSSPQGNVGGTSEAEKAARIAVEEAAVSIAEAALASAEEDLADAVLIAPVAGIVGEVPFNEGQAAAASDAITLLGTDAVEVTINVGLTVAETLSKGMAASVTADGAEEPAAGQVNTIGVLPDSSSGTSTYPVTILIPDPSAALAQGAAAAVSITLKSATDVVTVPNSALTPTGNGSSSFVTLIQDGKPVRKTVTVGAVGKTRTAVTEGLAEGDTVVLADADSDVPASSTTSTGPTGFGGGGQMRGGGGSFAVPGGGGFGGGGGRGR